MPITIIENSNSDALEARSFEVTISQIREDHHVYYRARVRSLGRGAQAYGHSPEAALTKLYDEVIPRLTGLKPSSTRTVAASPVTDRRERHADRAR